MTKEGICARVNIIADLAVQIRLLKEKITDAATCDDSLFDALDRLANGEETANEFWVENKECFDGLKDGTPIEACPIISVDPDTLSVEVIQPVEGGALIAATASPDDISPQASLMYSIEEGDKIDLAMAEVKRWYYAEADNKSPNNKDIDLYVYSDIHEEGYQSKYTFNQEEIVDMFKVDLNV